MCSHFRFPPLFFPLFFLSFSFSFFPPYFFPSSVIVPVEKWAKLAQAAVWNSEQQWWFTVIYIFGLHHALGSASHLLGGWIPSVFLFLLVFLSLQVCNSLWEAVPCVEVGWQAVCWAGAGLGLHPSLHTSALPSAPLTCLQTVLTGREHTSRAITLLSYPGQYVVLGTSEVAALRSQWCFRMQISLELNGGIA